MAEVTALRNNALPYPVYGAPWALDLVIFDADGDPVTGAAGLDSELSKNGDTPADCTNEATEIGASCKYYLVLTAAELTADLVSGMTKTSTSGAKNTPWTLYPKKLPAVRSGTAQGGASGSITLDSGASAVDDAYNGCLVVATLDGAVEARIITDYNGSTKVASVTPDWNTTPDSDDTFILYLPDGVQVIQANVTHWAGTAVASAVILAAANIASDAITAAKIAADAITSSKIADGALTAAKFASGAFDAVWTVGTRTLTSFGTLVADVATAVWGAGTRVLTAGTNIVLAKGTGVTGFNDLSAAQVNAEADQALADVGMTATVTGRVDVAVSTRLATSSYTAPDNAGIAAIASGVSALLTRIPSALFSGITSLAQWLGAMAGKQTADSTARTEMRATGDGSGTFNETTDSQEAVRDRGDAAWKTATGFSTHSAADVWAVGSRTLTSISALASEIRSAIGLAAANLDTQIGTLATSSALSTVAAAVSAIGSIVTSTASALATVATNVLAIKSKTDNLPEGIKKNQALANFPFFMVDAADHVTGKAGLTITAERRLDNGSFASCANAATEVSGGFYSINLAASDVNGDTVAFRFTAPGADATVLALKTAA